MKNKKEIANIIYNTKKEHLKSNVIENFKKETKKSIKKKVILSILFSLLIILILSLLIWYFIISDQNDENSENDIFSLIIICSIPGIFIVLRIIDIIKVFVLGPSRYVFEKTKMKASKSEWADYNENSKKPHYLLESKSIHSKIFKVTNTIDFYDLFNTIILIDSKNKLFFYKNDLLSSRKYSLSKIKDYEVFENNCSQLMYSETELVDIYHYFDSRYDTVFDFKLVIKLNDIDYPEIIIPYVINFSIDKNSDLYKKMLSDLKDILLVLDNIIRTCGRDNDMPLKEQLEELQDLLNSGLISKKEYQLKKQQILNSK